MEYLGIANNSLLGPHWCQLKRLVELYKEVYSLPLLGQCCLVLPSNEKTWQSQQLRCQCQNPEILTKLFYSKQEYNHIYIGSTISCHVKHTASL